MFSTDIVTKTPSQNAMSHFVRGRWVLTQTKSRDRSQPVPTIILFVFFHFLYPQIKRPDNCYGKKNKQRNIIL